MDPNLINPQYPTDPGSVQAGVAQPYVQAVPTGAAPVPTPAQTPLPVGYQPIDPQYAVQGAMPAQATAPKDPQVQQKSNPNSTQNTLQIAEIRDGIVIMNDGSFRSVIMVKSINFDLMSPQERESVEYSYQGFLNSLYFDIQIFIRSTKVDIGPYIDKLDKIRGEHDNMLLALLMEDYISYMINIAQHTNIMDKKFYVVVPYIPVATGAAALASSKNFFTGVLDLFSKKEPRVVINEPDLEKAKDELRNRVQAVLGGLQQCSIQGLPLDTQELIELYYDTYNPDTATRQQLKNFNDLTAPIITKGVGEAINPNLNREVQ